MLSGFGILSYLSLLYHLECLSGQVALRNCRYFVAMRFSGKLSQSQVVFIHPHVYPFLLSVRAAAYRFAVNVYLLTACFAHQGKSLLKTAHQLAGFIRLNTRQKVSSSGIPSGRSKMS